MPAHEEIAGPLQWTEGETVGPRRWGRRLHHIVPSYTCAQRRPRSRRSRSSPGVDMDGAGGGALTPLNLLSTDGRAPRTELAATLAAPPPFPTCWFFHLYLNCPNKRPRPLNRPRHVATCAPKLTPLAMISPIVPRFVLLRSPICAFVPPSYLVYSALRTPPWTSSDHLPVLDPETLLDLPMDLMRRHSWPLLLVGDRARDASRKLYAGSSLRGPAGASWRPVSFFVR